MIPHPVFQVQTTFAWRGLGSSGEITVVEIWQFQFHLSDNNRGHKNPEHLLLHWDYDPSKCQEHTQNAQTLPA